MATNPQHEVGLELTPSTSALHSAESPPSRDSSTSPTTWREALGFIRWMTRSATPRPRSERSDKPEKYERSAPIPVKARYPESSSAVLESCSFEEPENAVRNVVTPLLQEPADKEDTNQQPYSSYLYSWASWLGLGSVQSLTRHWLPAPSTGKPFSKGEVAGLVLFVLTGLQLEAVAPDVYRVFTEVMQTPACAAFSDFVNTIEAQKAQTDMEQKGQQIQHHLDSVTTDLQVILGDKFTDSVIYDCLEKNVMERLYPLFYLGVYLNLLYSVFGAPDELISRYQFIQPEHLDVRSNLLQNVNWTQAGEGSLPSSTGADDFLPVLVFVVIHANPPGLYSNMQYISHFRNPRKMMAESGYFFVSLLSAIAFIESIDVNSLTIDPALFDKCMGNFGPCQVQEFEEKAEWVVVTPKGSYLSTKTDSGFFRKEEATQTLLTSIACREAGTQTINS